MLFRIQGFSICLGFGFDGLAFRGWGSRFIQGLGFRV